MADIVDSATRSRMMASIRGKDTAPEMVIRRGLHSLGYRYRLHDKRLSGRPDLVFPKFHAVVFVHGCFWHGHECPYFRLPTTRREFWEEKIEGNKSRDQRTISTLRESGWRVMTVWECALRDVGAAEREKVVHKVAAWLESVKPSGEIRGKMRDKK